MHIATDGETYGHHHPKGEMALAYALHHIETNKLAKLTNYGEYLDHQSADPRSGDRREHRLELRPTAWAAGARDCGCNSGGKPGWNQAWRAPLRKALDYLRDEPGPNRMRRKASELLRDPWQARDEYINVVLDRGDGSLDRLSSPNTRKAELDRRRTP